MRTDYSKGEAAARALAHVHAHFLSLSASAGAPRPPAAVRAPQDVLSGVRVASQLLQDFRPITESIEWELGHLHWAQAGLLTFAENEVPYVVNNSGRLSEDAAALLFHHCADTAPQGTIAVLELGAGCGLFARMFLQAFRHLCQQEGRDFDQRLVCYVTDGSPRTVAQWHERGLFAEFGGQVVAGCCDAMHPEAVRLHDGSTVPLPPLHAVFCNYVLDVLPATVVRRQNGGPVQELRIRTRLTDDAQLVRQYTALSPHEIRALVDHADAAERARLLPWWACSSRRRDFSTAATRHCRPGWMPPCPSARTRHACWSTTAPSARCRRCSSGWRPRAWCSSTTTAPARPRRRPSRAPPSALAAPAPSA